MKKAKGIKGKGDREWSRRVRGRDRICRLCGSRPSSNAHHIMDRRHKATRLVLSNGIGLCVMCHHYVEALSKMDWANPWGNTNEYAECMSEIIGANNYAELQRLAKKTVKYTDDFVLTVLSEWGVEYAKKKGSSGRKTATKRVVHDAG